MNGLMPSLWEWVSNCGIGFLVKRWVRPPSLLSFLHVLSWPLTFHQRMMQQEGFARCWLLDFGLPNLQNCKRYISLKNYPACGILLLQHKQTKTSILAHLNDSCFKGLYFVSDGSRQLLKEQITWGRILYSKLLYGFAVREESLVAPSDSVMWLIWGIFKSKWQSWIRKCSARLGLCVHGLDRYTGLMKCKYLTKTMGTQVFFVMFYCYLGDPDSFIRGREGKENEGDWVLALSQSSLSSGLYSLDLKKEVGLITSSWKQNGRFISVTYQKEKKKSVVLQWLCFLTFLYKGIWSAQFYLSSEKSD